jgi:glycogen operon protein
MPDEEYAAEWTGEIDTTDPRGATQLVVKAGEKISLEPRSLLVMRKTA